MIRRFWLAALVLAALSVPAASARAQGYPSRTIRIVVPFAAGGATDSVARLLGAKLAEALGQSVVIENKAGAGGNLGADTVAKSEPDGHTILLTTNGQAISPALYSSLSYDPVKDLVPVTQLVESPLALVVIPKLPANSLGELLALAKAQPGRLNYGSTGVGNPLHLTMEMIKRATGADIVMVPYRGDAPLNTALLAGEVEMAVIPVGAAVANVEAKLVRALAVTTLKRSAALPDVPTLAEAGVDGIDSGSWLGLFAPAGTPRDVVLRLQVAAKNAMAQPDVRDRLKVFDWTLVGTTPEAFAQKFREDMALYAKVVQEVGIPKQN